MNEKGRTIFYGIAGAYLVYLAYDMFQTKAATGNAMLFVFSVLFAVAGILLLIAAGKSYKKSLEEDAQTDDTTEDTENEAK